jgi:hypothetical protein
MSERPPLNVNVSKADERRIAREEEFWTGPKLVVLCIVTLGFALTALYFMSNLPMSQG